MSFGSISSPVATNYLLTINQLSARNAPVTAEEVQETKQLQQFSTISSLASFSPIIISIVLFVSTFIFLMMRQLKNFKNISMAVGIALFAACIPTVMNMSQGGVHQNVRAGPEEVPREIRVEKIDASAVQIRWLTDAVKIGSVRMRQKGQGETQYRVHVGDDQQAIKQHSVNITNLKKNQSYEFEILSGSTWYDNAGETLSFTFK